MLKTALFLVLVISLLAVSLGGALALDLPANRLVSTAWLNRHLDSGDLRLIDVRPKITDYWSAHLPGALYLAPDSLRAPDHGIPGMLMPADALVALFGVMGLTPSSTIVVYGERSDYNPTYLLWALNYLGNTNVAILDGGFAKWQNEKRPTTQNYPPVCPTTYRPPAPPDDSLRAELPEIIDIVENGGALLLDVRSPGLYRGEIGFWKRTGHIKGAISHFWEEDLNQDGTWKRKELLRAEYNKLGVATNKRIIVSCGQGLMSSHTYFTLKYILGHANVENYDGSFNEWSHFDALPVKTGPDK